MGKGFIVCEHIKDNGTRCGSPAMVGRRFCFYHLRFYDPTQLPGTREYRMPVLDSHNSIQLMIAQLQRAYLAGTISDRQMTNLLYSLQLASNNHDSVKTPASGTVCTHMTSGMMEAFNLAPGEYEVAPEVPYNVIPIPRSPEEAIELARELIVHARPDLQEVIERAEEEKRQQREQQQLEGN